MNLMVMDGLVSRTNDKLVTIAVLHNVKYEPFLS